MAGKEPPTDGSDRDTEREKQQAEEADREPLPRRLPDRERGERDEEEQRGAHSLPLTV
jgi:hypothetical protein